LFVGVGKSAATEGIRGKRTVKSGRRSREDIAMDVAEIGRRK